MYTRLTINGTTYGADDIFEATYTQIVNPGQQLTLGTVSSAQLVFKTENSFQVGTEVKYECRAWNDPSLAWTNRGYFLITEVTQNKQLFTYTCYDFAQKLDKIIDSWWGALTWPKTLAELFGGVAAECGLAYDPNFDGAPASIAQPKFSAVNLRGKSIVQWVAQIAGGFAYVDITKTLKIRQFSTDGRGDQNELTQSDYTKLEKANYTVPQPDWIQIQKNNSGDVWDWTDAGLGTKGTELIKISGNPFCYSDTFAGSGADYACNIIRHDWVPSYVPYSCDLVDYTNIWGGEGVDIRAQDDTWFSSTVMTVKIDKNGVHISAAGPKERNETTELKQEQIVYQSPQEWFDQGVVNSTGAFGTAGISLKNDNFSPTYYGGPGHQDYDLSFNGLILAAGGGDVNYRGRKESEVRLSVFDADAGIGVSTYVNSGGIITGSSGGISPYNLSFTTEGIRGYTAYFPSVATNGWNNVSSTQTTSEPSSYSSLPASIYYPDAIKYFILELCNSDGSSIYATTTIMAWPRGTQREETAIANYTVQTGASSVASYQAHCKINWQDYTYKLWRTGGGSYYARLISSY